MQVAIALRHNCVCVFLFLALAYAEFKFSISLHSSRESTIRRGKNNSNNIFIYILSNSIYIDLRAQGLNFVFFFFVFTKKIFAFQLHLCVSLLAAKLKFKLYGIFFNSFEFCEQASEQGNLNFQWNLIRFSFVKLKSKQYALIKSRKTSQNDYTLETMTTTL